MSLPSVASSDKDPIRFQARDVLLWAGAALAAAALHAGGVIYFQNRPAPEPPPQQLASAVMIDLAPLAVAPDAVPEEIPDIVENAAPQPVENLPPEEVEPEPLPEPVVEEEPVEEMPVEQAEPELPEPVVEEPIEEVLPEVPEVTETMVAVTLPKPRPKIDKPIVKKAVEKRVEKKPPPKKVEKKQAPKKKAPPPSQASRAKADAAPKAAAPTPNRAKGRTVSPAKWQSLVNAHLNRHKRFPKGGGQGTASVRFTINAGGQVLAATLVRSSGDAALDAEAVNMVRRASPVPAPPPSIARSRMNLTVPVRFDRR